MFLKGFVTSLAVSFILIGAALAQDLKPMPPTHTDPVPSESPVVPAPSEAASAPEQKLVSTQAQPQVPRHGHNGQCATQSRPRRTSRQPQFDPSLDQ